MPVRSVNFLRLVAMLGALAWSGATAGAAADAEGRAKLPEFKTIPAAADSELTPAESAPTPAQFRTWTRSNGDSSNTRYSELTQINRETVRGLKPAWVYHSGGRLGDRDRNNIQATPVIVDGIIYAPAIGKVIVAIDGATGAELWRFKPPEATEAFGENYGPAHRGLLYWAGAEASPARLFFTASGYLYALDPKLGTPIASFGRDGRVPARGPTAPVADAATVVVSDLGAIKAFDARSGRERWTHDLTPAVEKLLSPQPGAAARKHYYPGGSAWGGMALDEKRGLVVFSTGAPHPNFVGVRRPGNNEPTNSVIALDIRDGRAVWSFQDIAHNLWDLDIPAPPNLVSIQVRGRLVDAVAQVTKQGNTLLLDRTSGKPIFPYRLRRAPGSTVPGETTAEFQPDLVLPEPFARQEFSLEDVTHLNPAAREFVLRQLDGAVFGWFQPPVEGKKVAYYGVHGGAEWTGASFDPATGILYVSANNLAWLAGLSRAVVPAAQGKPSAGAKVYAERCSACHGENRQGVGVAPALLGVAQTLDDARIRDILDRGRNAMPPMPMAAEEQEALLNFLFSRGPADHVQSTVPTVLNDGSLVRLLDDRGYPGVKPPWGTLNAIDLNSGKLKWSVPLGEYDELTRLGVPPTGTENFGGPMATAGGLVFCAGTKDLKIRAFDSATGEELWQDTLPAGGFSPPATYEANGRQYVVIAASGGGKLGGPWGDAWVAFALDASTAE